MSFRTLLLNGSPSGSGQSMTLAALVLRDLPSEVTVAHLYGENISPCTGCMACAEGGPCPIPDAMPKLTSMLSGADILLVASPLHFTSLTAPVIAFFSRLQPFWHSRGRKGALPPPIGKRLAGLAVTAGGRYPGMFRPARSVAAAAFNSLGRIFVGMAAASDTDSLPVAKNGQARREAKALGDALREALG